MIQLQQVTKIYNGTTAVNKVSFAVQPGQTMVLLGTSGSGKTTTLRMINRLTDPSSGIIEVNDQNILQQSPDHLRRGIGYVLQHHGLFPHYTVAQNIGIVPGLLQWSKEKTTKRTHELLHKLGLPPQQFAGMYPHQLSGGQQQRVGLARALAADPPILLMDEPFGALDPINRSAIRHDITQLDEFKKKTIVLVTHDVQEAFELADRICVMHDGGVVQTGTPSNLLFKPATPFVAAFLQQQSLQLQLQVTTLAHIIHHLPVVTTNNHESIVASTPLWKVLEQLSAAQGTPVVAANGQQYLLTPASVMQAFHVYKQEATL